MAKINKNELTKEMLEKAMQCETAEDLIALAKTEGVELTKEEANAYLDELSECELKDGDLKHVAGGKKNEHKKKSGGDNSY
jgi:predicted ribosomally synthesized peptide with nif11-like leader